MTEPDFQQLLQRYLDGRCSPPERAQVEQWYERLRLGEARARAAPPRAAVEEAIWQRLVRTLPSHAAPGRVVHPPAAWWQTPPVRWAAALVLLAVALGVLWPSLRRAIAPPAPPALLTTTANGWTRQTNATRRPQPLRLPDGSRVTLYPGSSLRYPAALAGTRRPVQLVGEAYFQVSKNPRRPFLVLTRQTVTTVLGTSFRVKAYPNAPQTAVAVREGKVSVQARAGADLSATPTRPAPAGVLLLPNQQVVYSAAARQLRKELVDKPVVLVPQVFEFEERPVPEVLAALEKAYGVEIVYDRAKLKDCTVSITFYDEPLFEKLGLLCKSLGAYYSLADAQVILHSDGCQNKY